MMMISVVNTRLVKFLLPERVATAPSCRSVVETIRALSDGDGVQIFWDGNLLK